MKLIFAGTPEFAVPSLQALLNSEHQVIAVYTQPDRPAGRGQKLAISPVKQLALAVGIPVIQPITLRDPVIQQTLCELPADAMIVVAYGLIIPAPVLKAFPYGCINVHGSLLPRWRGAAPVERALLAGDTQTGITIMQMDEGLDTGGILQQAVYPIKTTDTSALLREHLAEMGATLLLESLAGLASGKLHAVAQDNEQACYAKKIEKSEARIVWQDSALQIDRAVRAFNPFPIAFTQLGELTIRIWQTQVLTTEKTDAAPGMIIRADKHGIDVATGAGILRLLQIQLPGGRCLPVNAVLNAKAALFAPGEQFQL